MQAGLRLCCSQTSEDMFSRDEAHLRARKALMLRSKHADSSGVQLLTDVIRRVKSGKFGHAVNPDIHLQTVEIQMRLMTSLIRIFTVCLVNIYFYSNN